LALAAVLGVCAGCAPVEQLPVGGETRVLVLGAVAYRAPLVPSNVEFADDVPAFVLHYDEASAQLPWTDETRLVRDGLRVPLPTSLWSRTATTWARSSGLAAGWRIARPVADSRCALLRLGEPEVATSTTVVRWSEHEVLETDGTAIYVRSRTARSRAGQATHPVRALINVGLRRAIANAPQRYSLVTTLSGDTATTRLESHVLDQPVRAFAGQAVSGTGAAAFALMYDNTIRNVSWPTIGPPLPGLTLRWQDLPNAIFAAGPDLVIRRDFTALYYPATSPTDSVEPLSRPYLREITTVALLPSLGTSRDGHPLGLIAAATAVLPGDPEDKRTAILLRYVKPTQQWRPYAILDGFTRITQLAEHEGAVFFAGDAGWGVYSPKSGACQGEGTIAPVEQLVALDDGTFYLVGADRQDPSRRVSAWLVPE